MSGELGGPGGPGDLFERSAQEFEMRPEFRARLVELYAESVSHLRAGTEPSAQPVDLIETASARASWQNQPRSRIWLKVAATVVVVVGLAMLDSRSSEQKYTIRPGGLD
jgi:hypothetical protein